MRNKILWLFWFLVTLVGASAIAAAMYYGGDFRKLLLIGKTTSAHHQIELACDACHTSMFGGIDALQKGCVNCHGEELKAAHDSHPRTKFIDPRNADRVAKLDARYCVTCHREHQPGITNAMAVTMPDDYCALCHKDVAKERPSHEGLGFDTCASSGCHNFHDNRALYEDFLEKRHAEPDFKEVLLVSLRNWVPPVDPQAPAKPKPLTLTDADAPAAHRGDAKHTAEWAASGHAEAGVNCSACHQPRKRTRPDEWIASPGMEVCSTCHAAEVKTFTEGKHGMRQRPGLWTSRKDDFIGLFEDRGLTPMTPALARLPMEAKAHDTVLDCNTCHGAHKYDVVFAQVEACETCHADEHTQAYRMSQHNSLRDRETEGELRPGSAVTCATCHMPRHLARDDYGGEKVFVTHNQNDNLRPNEKMIRSVCADCHGLRFSIDALADPALIKNNFKGKPAHHVESIDWVVNRMRERARRREQQ